MEPCMAFQDLLTKWKTFGARFIPTKEITVEQRYYMYSYTGSYLILVKFT